MHTVAAVPMSNPMSNVDLVASSLVSQQPWFKNGFFFSCYVFVPVMPIDMASVAHLRASGAFFSPDLCCTPVLLVFRPVPRRILKKKKREMMID